MSALRPAVKRSRFWVLLIAAAALAAAAILDWRRPPSEQASVQLYVRFIIRPYQQYVRPVSGRFIHCRYRPSCSEYSFYAFQRFGFAKGLWLTATRILRCGPWVPMGMLDPVPMPPGHSKVEPRIKSMDSSTKDKAEGAKDQAVGQIKKTTGEVTGNEDLEARGTAQKAEGKVEEKTGDVKKVFET